LVKAEKSREDGKSGKGVASDGKDEKDDGSEKGKSGKDRSSDSKDGKDGEDKGLGDEDDEIDDAVDKALGGNSLMDDHNKNDEIKKTAPYQKPSWTAPCRRCAGQDRELFLIPCLFLCAAPTFDRSLSRGTWASPCF